MEATEVVVVRQVAEDLVVRRGAEVFEAMVENILPTS